MNRQVSNVLVVLGLLIAVGGTMFGQRWRQTGGPPGAEIRSFAIDPVNRATVYCAGSGLYKSIDSGKSWRKMADAPSYSVLVNPMNGNSIFVDNMRSTDGGETFEILPLPGGVGRFTAMTFAGGDTSVLIAGTSHGSVYLSTDAGTTWATSATGLDTCPGNCPITALAVSAESTSIMLAGSLYRSTNGGGLWEAAMGFQTSTIVSDPANTHSFFAGTALGLYHSSDNGLSWELFGVPQFNVTAAAVDPSDSNTIYIGTGFTGIWKTTNRGATWLEANHGVPANSAAMQTLSLAIDQANPSVLFQGTAAGVYRSNDGGETWSAAGQGIAAAEAFSVATGPNGTRFAGTLDGVYRQHGSTGPWTLVGGRFGGRVIAVSPKDTNVIIHEYSHTTGSALETSTDGGETWPGNVLLQTPAFDIEFAPSNPAIVYTPGQGGILVSTNSGLIWTGPSIVDECSAVAVSPDAPGHVIASGDHALYRSTDTARTWTSHSFGGAYGNIRLAYSSSPPYHLFAAVNDSGIFRSFDDGSTWENLDFPLANPAFRGIAADIGRGFIVAGTATDGIYISSDAGETWHSRNEGLPTLNVRAVALEQPKGAIVSLAGIGGVYEIDDLALGVGEHERPVGEPDRFALLGNYPNPFNPATTIRMRLPVAARVTMTVYNLLGQAIATIDGGLMDAGDTEIRWNAGDAASGTYFYMIEAKNGVRVFKGAGKMVFLK